MSLQPWCFSVWWLSKHDFCKIFNSKLHKVFFLLFCKIPARTAFRQILHCISYHDFAIKSKNFFYCSVWHFKRCSKFLLGTSMIVEQSHSGHFLIMFCSWQWDYLIIWRMKRKALNGMAKIRRKQPLFASDHSWHMYKATICSTRRLVASHN